MSGAPLDAAPTAIDAVGQSVRLLSVQKAAEPDFLARWHALVSDACEPNLFFEPWFLLPSLHQLAPDEAAQVFALFEGPSLVGLLPIT